MGNNYETSGYQHKITPKMNRKVTVNEIREFLAAALRQFEQGGIYVERVRVKRTETGDVQDIYIDYEERDITANTTK